MVCLKGRVHLYEGISPAFIKTYVRTLKCLGCDYFIATNASGSLKEDMPPGELMLICDHINFQGTNPLVGPNDDEFGPRFLPLDKAYDAEIAAHLIKAAKTCQIKLNQGVYLAVLGPTYETAAEIKAFKILGADAVGMSTVPEVLVAHHAGMKVGAIATITNFATGLTSVSHDHNEVVKVAHVASTHLTQILQQFLRQIHHG
jgi:xanthosine phosphorylase